MQIVLSRSAPAGTEEQWRREELWTEQEVEHRWGRECGGGRVAVEAAHILTGQEGGPSPSGQSEVFLVLDGEWEGSKALLLSPAT